MEKLLGYIAALESVASALVGATSLPDSVREAAQKVVDAGEAVKAELANPNPSRILSYLKHHGNLPGTPESRGER